MKEKGKKQLNLTISALENRNFSTGIGAIRAAAACTCTCTSTCTTCA
ncbi:MAG: hypothetical protein ACEPOW_05810 [Bacteroidales bacterium]